ncbi:hypothetical protein [Actinoplanes sp. NPDC049118]|uniref:NACHT domain-containing protein n=1 Tax=Actinoplanes sp. NPDC049118 TaxID=3155769 RepID=UPI0033E54134
MSNVMAGSLYTLETARELLLGKRSKAVKVLDRLLGAGILAAGPIGLVTGQPWMIVAWGWIDQKNELVTRLDELVDLGRQKLGKAVGHQRHELLAATHSALVTGSFLAALKEVAGPLFEELALTDTELERLVGASQPDDAFRSAVHQLLRVEISLPWAGRGFQSNLSAEIRPYHEGLADRCLHFFSGLEPWERHFGGRHQPRRPLARQIVDRAAERYRAEYYALAAELPEFKIWALFGEHDAEQNALGRLEELVGTLVSAVRAPAAAARNALIGINRAVLARHIVDLDENTQTTAIRAPTVERGYVEPRFRWAVMSQGSHPSQETWWKEQAQGTDLSGFLAAHFASPQSATRPLVVLGHPGSGKSLLTKVCAARLSATDALITVRVPLRDVPDPSASVYKQIEDVLRESTHGRVEWPTLCEASHKTVRVVLIDGLDELMQATGATESRYLRNVMDFQRTEAASSGPVAVVVTSRTVVADVAAIPAGCLIIKLEEFTDRQIDMWVERWTEANAAAISRGELHAMESTTLREYRDLARQPLLLLLLAIVASERELPPHETPADLYRTLLDDFVRRELVRPDRGSAHLTDEERYTEELWKLGLVAFGMLNRGQQYLNESDLTADLRALPPPVPLAAPQSRDIGRTLDPARRVVGRFFFVHTSEAEGGAAGRSYEFLHATFGDYLVAHHIVGLLRDAATAREHRTAFQPWDDDLLFALLSHRVIVGYGSHVLGFFIELVADDTAVASVLEHLAAIAHDRWTKGRHSDYSIPGHTVVERIAIYTANIVAMRLGMAHSPVPISRLCPPNVDVKSWWQSQVRLWVAVLKPNQWRPLIDRLTVREPSDPIVSWKGVAAIYEDLVQMVALDTETAVRLSSGRAVARPDGTHSYGLAEPRAAYQLVRSLSLLYSYNDPHSIDNARVDREFPPIDSLENEPEDLLRLRMAVIAQHGTEVPYDIASRVLRFCIGSQIEISPEVLAMLVVHYPNFEHEFPNLIDKIKGETSRFSDAALNLAALIEDESDSRLRSVRTADLSNTPEGEAISRMPADLARRMLPALAASFVRRSSISRYAG